MAPRDAPLLWFARPGGRPLDREPSGRPLPPRESVPAAASMTKSPSLSVLLGPVRRFCMPPLLIPRLAGDEVRGPVGVAEERGSIVAVV